VITQPKGLKALFVLTQLAYHFNGRTDRPLGPSPAPGCDAQNLLLPKVAQIFL